MKHWVDIPVRAMIQIAFPGLAVNLENDADAAALAEWRWGLDCKIDDVIYLTCGTGQGAGLIVGGRLHRGASNLAGEIGHVRLTPIGPVGCNKAGSVEGLTSGRALGEIGKLRLGEPHEKSSLDSIPIDQITGKHIGEAALAGDATAIRIVQELGTHLGHACAILIDVLNPQRISLGSLAVRLGDLLLPSVRTAAKAEAMSRSFEACTIDKAALGDRVQDLAALAAACEKP
jgi:glucokinase